MLGNLGAWIRDFKDDSAAAPLDDSAWSQALAGLLVEAAMADGNLDAKERSQVAAALEADLHMTSEEVATVIDAAVTAQEGRVEIHSLTRSIRSEADAEDRVAIMEMAWMVVLADGELHEYEAQLMRRLAGLLFVDDIDSGKGSDSWRCSVEQRNKYQRITGRYPSITHFGHSEKSNYDVRQPSCAGH